MKKILLGALVAFFVTSNANAAQDVPQCPYPNIVAGVGLDHVDKASMGEFVYGENNYGTAQTWMFETGILPSNFTYPVAIAAANAGIVSMGKVLGPITDDNGGSLCFYYSYMTQLIAVAATEPLPNSPNLKNYILANMQTNSKSK